MIMTIYLVVIKLKRKTWTKEEIEKLKALWESDATVDEILEEFPDRTLASLQNKCARERFKRP